MPEWQLGARNVRPSCPLLSAPVRGGGDRGQAQDRPAHPAQAPRRRSSATVSAAFASRSLARRRGGLQDIVYQTLVIAVEQDVYPCHLSPDPGRLRVRAIRGGLWCDERVAPQVPEPPVPPTDLARVDRLRRSAQRTELTIEYDVFPMTAASVAADDSGSYLPAVFMLVDRKTGVVVRSALQPPENRHSAAAAELLVSFDEHGLISQAVVVRHPKLARLIRPTLDALGVKLEVAGKLPALVGARRALEGAAAASSRLAR
jgi:hypothetical protein